MLNHRRTCRDAPAAIHRATCTLRGRRVPGFSMVELVCVLAVLSILAALAYPSFAQQVRQGRRADAVAATAQVVQAQERWRSGRPAYTTDLSAPGGLGLSSDPDVLASADGHYRLTLTQAGTDHYELHLVATGGQARDVPCRHLQLRVQGGGWERRSGPDARLSNPPEVNRSCWRQ